MCKICIAQCLVVVIFPWCNANLSTFSRDAMRILCLSLAGRWWHAEWEMDQLHLWSWVSHTVELPTSFNVPAVIIVPWRIIRWGKGYWGVPHLAENLPVSPAPPPHLTLILFLIKACPPPPPTIWDLFLKIWKKNYTVLHQFWQHLGLNTVSERLVSCLRGYYSPSLKLACFVCYLKITIIYFF